MTLDKHIVQKCKFGTPLYNFKKCTLYNQKTYGPGVKISEWQKHSESQPIDTDPYCPEGLNLHLSHYNRFGTDEDENRWSTVTQESLRQIYNKRTDLDVNPNKSLVNLYTQIDTECYPKTQICSAIHGQDYMTTMQHSFQPPYPFELKRLSMQKTPHFLYRKMKGNGMCQFQDDDYILQTKRLQAHKKSHHVSYDPCKNCYNDGSQGVVKENKCTELNY